MGRQNALFSSQDPESNENMDNLRRNPHLEVYSSYSILIDENERALFLEGKQSDEAQRRYRKITRALDEGYLVEMIKRAASPDAAESFLPYLSSRQATAIENVVASVTAQSGRALTEIFVVQLVVKSISLEQDVRLHKGSTSKGNFSWQEGISLRHIDDKYIAPALRESGLLLINKFGAFMTRTFAENYPFTVFYKAEVTGARNDWLALIDELEEGKLHPEAALLFTLHLLWRSSERFDALVKVVIELTKKWFEKYSPPTVQKTLDIIISHIEASEARARLLEVAMHALMQALSELGIDLNGRLKPLMPMRTANLKHGNLGDIELLIGDLVSESWDAKYRTPYLSDAIEELHAKVRGRNVSGLVFGYVVFPETEYYKEVDNKIAQMKAEFGLNVEILSFREWVNWQVGRAINQGVAEGAVAQRWLIAYVESLCLLRRRIAPIDEPTYEWIVTLAEVFKARI